METKMNNTDCPCKRTKCERHGNCNACQEHHHRECSRKPLTACEKAEKKEQKRTDKRRKRERLIPV